ncbi:MAG TPA: DUF3108 domain-containing protein [Xanthobacteraceae bacterium]|jgi:Protein of unknown function (DUF3108)
MFGNPLGSTRQAPYGFGLCAALAALSLAGTAHADTRLDAHYTIKVARIAIGKSEVLVSVGDAAFTSAASGQASGMMRFVVSGEGAMRTTGAVVDGKLVPASFVLGTAHDEEHDAVKMTIAGGDVKDLTAETNVPQEERVPVTDADRKGILDPLTAMLIPMEGAGDMVAADACRRTLPIFDGRRRFDLALSFKRIDQVKADTGYAGPAVVCAVAFHPIAGHRPGSALLKYLTGGRDIELTFAPIAGTRLLAPFRLAISSLLGNLVIEATDFTATTAQPAAPAAATASK